MKQTLRGVVLGGKHAVREMIFLFLGYDLTARRMTDEKNFEIE